MTANLFFRFVIQIAVFSSTLVSISSAADGPVKPMRIERAVF